LRWHFASLRKKPANRMSFPLETICPGSPVKRLRSAVEYAGHALPWQLQAPLFFLLFVVVGSVCSIPDETFPSGFTVNQALEDFGVFLLFTALWTGIYAHFRREIDLFWLTAIFVVALFQEEFNIWNRLLQVIGEPLGYVMTSKERQRGDVFMLAAVFGSLLIRFLSRRASRASCASTSPSSFWPSPPSN
jgi:hypothetical protein